MKKSADPKEERERERGEREIERNERRARVTFSTMNRANFSAK